MKHFLFCLLALASMAVGANAQNRIDLDGFYVEVASPVHIKIGLTDGRKFFVEDDDRKMDVEVFSVGTQLDGYSAAGHTREIADPDFVINDAATEVSTFKAKEARQFIRALTLARADVKLQLDVDLGKARKDDNREQFLVPADKKQAIVAAYNAMRRR